MKRKIKTLIMLSLSVSILALNNLTVVEASAAQQIGMYKNDSEIIKGDKPFIKDGRTYVPLRTIGDLLGVNTVYDNKTKSVTISNNEIIANFEIGNNTYIVNGETYVSEMMPIIKSERLYVPLRVIGEVFGAEISIDSKTKSILIDFKKSNYDKKIHNEGLDEDLDEDLDANLEMFQKDLINLLVEIANSKEFDEFRVAILNSEDFENQITDMLNSENFKSLLNRILSSSEYKILIEEIKSKPEYISYENDIKNIESFNELVEKYGEEALLNPLLNSNFTAEEYVNLANLLLNDKSYIDFLNECTKLKTYNAYQDSIINLLNSPSYTAFLDNIKNMEEFKFVGETFSKILIDTIIVLPESKPVLLLYDKGMQEIISKKTQSKY